MLVLLGTEKAAVSEPVRFKIEGFLTTGRPIIPISFDSALERAEWFGLIQGLSISKESTDAMKAGKPSEHVLTRIVSAGRLHAEKPAAAQSVLV
jgi:hypothetical protein